mmetsp:Transcript_10122/g.33117  ORF Transcript_10122/g.33117 Transcript_10122/m.33117 type:complete len:209 (-) Transcript_10122:37-663(-)
MANLRHPPRRRPRRHRPRQLRLPRLAKAVRHVPRHEPSPRARLSRLLPRQGLGPHGPALGAAKQGLLRCPRSGPPLTPQRSALHPGFWKPGSECEPQLRHVRPATSGSFASELARVNSPLGVPPCRLCFFPPSIPYFTFPSPLPPLPPPPLLPLPLAIPPFFLDTRSLQCHSWPLFLSDKVGNIDKRKKREKKKKEERKTASASEDKS